MDDRAKADMAAIKEREAITRQAIAFGVNEIEIGQFTVGQLGLSPVVVDRNGRLWRHEPGRLTLIRPRGC